MLQGNSNIREPLRLLFAGGCQVEGYPVGKKNSYPTVIGKLLSQCGIPSEISRISYLSLSSAKRLFECTDNPDVLILQMGHYELNFSSRTRKLTRWLRHSGGSTRNPNWQPQDYYPMPTQDSGSWHFRLRDGARSALDAAALHSFVDMPTYFTRMEQFLRTVRLMAVSRVLVLSPIPCIDSVTMRYRRLAMAIRPIVESLSFDFVDLMSMDPGVRRPILSPPEFYADAYHLGVAGHQAAAREILRVLRPGSAATAVRTAQEDPTHSAHALY